jgi:hypothetical protein
MLEKDMGRMPVFTKERETVSAKSARFKTLRMVPRRLPRHLFARITFRRWSETLECDLGTRSQSGGTQNFEECPSKSRDPSKRDQLPQGISEKERES